jgi:hypothetical protein
MDRVTIELTPRTDRSDWMVRKVLGPAGEPAKESPQPTPPPARVSPRVAEYLRF